MNAAWAVSKMTGLMFGESVSPSKSSSTVVSTVTNWTSGLAAAASPAAAPRSKPVVTMSVQFWSIRLWMFGAKSEEDVERTSRNSIPSSSAARSRPSYESWLNDLSWKPPGLAPDTTQGRKPSTTSLPASAVSSVSSGADAQPARATNMLGGDQAAEHTLSGGNGQVCLHGRRPARTRGCYKKLPTVTAHLH